MITALNMVVLMQPDLEAAITFYQLFGLELKVHVPGRWAEFVISGCRIGLCPTEERLADKRSGLIFTVHHVQDMYERYAAHVPFLSKPIENVYGVMLSVKDPGGNIFDLYEPMSEAKRDILSRVVRCVSTSKTLNERPDDAPCASCCCAKK